MQPPIEIKDRSEYKRKMNELIRIDPRRTVVMTVDMQNDYLDVERGHAPVAAEESKRVIGHARSLLEFAREAGLPIIHVYVKRRTQEIGKGTLGTPLVRLGNKARITQNAQAEARKVPDRVEGTHQAEVPAVLVAPGDIHVTAKRAMDGFLETDLDMLLARVFKAETVVITGINTDTCVYSTTFGASNRGYQPIVISDCVASMRGLDNHWMALELMSRSIAWVMTVDEFKSKVVAAKQIAAVA